MAQVSARNNHNALSRVFTERIITFVSSKLFWQLTILWFIVQAIVIAATTKFGIAPDEMYHYQYIQLFAREGFSPFITNQEGFHVLGEAIRTPFFAYHYLLSLPYHFTQDTSYPIHLLRGINILLGVGSLYFVGKISDALGLPKLVKNLSVFMLANTLMFVFLSASINYDNLFVFVALASFLLLFLITKKPTMFRVLLLTTCLLGGLFIKVNFLPIVVIIPLILLFLYRGSLQKTTKKIWASRFESKTSNIALGAFIILLLGLFAQRYIYNLATYQDFSPACDKVLTIEQCRDNHVFARNEKLNNEVRPSATKPTAEYVYDWMLLMQQRTYGVFGHKSFEPIKPISTALLLLFIFGVAATIRLYKPSHRSMTILILSSALYISVLLFDNYSRYKTYGSFTFAVQGRYVFAVLPLMYIIGNRYMLELFRSSVSKSLFIVGLVGLFFCSSLPTFIRQTSTEWRNNPAYSISKQIHSIF